jgi:hypothetical protein
VSDDRLPSDLDIARLRRDLADVVDARIEVPPDVDRAIAARARERLHPSVYRVSWRQRALGWAAAAAVLVIGLVVARTLLPGRAGPTPVASGAPAGDVDGSGRVDVLDAFILARRIADGGTVPAADLNGDGSTDALDVDAIAMIAVSLEGSG